MFSALLSTRLSPFTWAIGLSYDCVATRMGSERSCSLAANFIWIKCMLCPVAKENITKSNVWPLPTRRSQPNWWDKLDMCPKWNPRDATRQCEKYQMTNTGGMCNKQEDRVWLSRSRNVSQSGLWIVGMRNTVQRKWETTKNLEEWV